MTTYVTARRFAPGRHRLHRGPGRLQPFLRAATAIALGGGGTVALLVAFVLVTYNQLRVGMEMTGLGALLMAGSTWLALPPGEAWRLLTGGES